MKNMFMRLLESDPVFPNILSAGRWDENGLPVQSYLSPRLSNDCSADIAVMRMAEARQVRLAYLDSDRTGLKHFYEHAVIKFSSEYGSMLFSLGVAKRGYVTLFAEECTNAAELVRLGKKIGTPLKTKPRIISYP